MCQPLVPSTSISRKRKKQMSDIEKQELEALRNENAQLRKGVHDLLIKSARPHVGKVSMQLTLRNLLDLGGK